MTTKDWAQALITLFLLALLICAPVACTMYDSRMLAEMVKAGAEPQAAACAVYPPAYGSGRSATCLLLAKGAAKP